MKANKKKRAVALVGIVAVFVMSAVCSCAPSVVEEGAQDSASSQEEVAFAWTADSDCGTCHVEAVESFDDQACSASMHPDLKDDCFSCHVDEQGLGEAHDGVSMGDKKKRPVLKDTEVPQETCIECHPKDEIVAKTASSTALTDKNGLTVNPHDVPENDDHAGAGITCSTCHKPHSQDPVQKTASETCLNCHHADVYECNTCHLPK